jgi:hypothetical protein
VRTTTVLSALPWLLLALLLGLRAANSEHLYSCYHFFVFNPIQSLRGIVWGHLPISLGDLWYFVLGLWLCNAIVFLCRARVKDRSPKSVIWGLVYNALTGVMALYLLLQVGWGINYGRAPLAERWKLLSGKDTISLRVMDSTLIERLNETVGGYAEASLSQVQETARNAFITLTDCSITSTGLSVKPSMYGFFLRRLGIEGYYNPFTGEGQVDEELPTFFLPFVVTHEMAHQAGRCSERDANLLAYALCTRSRDKLFQYAAYFTVWQYAHRRLARQDSSLAKRFTAYLNPTTQEHLRIVAQLNQLYDNAASVVSAEAYDSYLKLQAQEKGIRGYAEIIADSWLLERNSGSPSIERFSIY